MDLSANELDNLDEMENFLEKQKLLKVVHEVIENLNRLLTKRFN